MPETPFLLTSLAAYKTAQGSRSASQDSEINALLYTASDMIARYCNRARGTTHFIESTSRTEEHDVRRGQREWWLRASPVVSITSVEFDEERDWDSGSWTLGTDDYECELETGRLRMRYELHRGRFPERYLGALRVTYVGGIADSLQALKSYAPSLELATQLLIKSMLTRTQFGPAQGNKSGGGASRSMGEQTIPAMVKALCNPYRISNLGRP